MSIIVYSNYKLSDTDKTKIQHIFKEAECRNEALKNTFGKDIQEYNEYVICPNGNRVYTLHFHKTDAGDEEFIEEI